jgi:hypothetical protein
MDKLLTKEIVFRLSCKSLEGLVMSLTVDEFIRMLQPGDPAIKKLREQFSIKIKMRTDRIREDDDLEDDGDDDDVDSGKIKH